MNKKFLGTLATAAFAVSMSATASHAFLGFEPGETLGQALGAPLPEGLFFIDNEAYGRRDTRPTQLPDGSFVGGGGAAVPNNFGANVGVNIPALVYSTPFTAYDTRLEILYAAPFIHTDGPAANTATANRVDIFQQAIGPIIAHDFGNDFGASLILLLRPPSEHFFNYTYADLRASFSYTGNGLDITATFGYTGTFGGQQGGTAFGIQRNPFTGNVITAGNSDAVDLDFTATKKFGKFEIGFVGFAQTDINTRGVNSIVLADGTLVSKRQGAVAVGGLLGYDFGRFTLQGYATREVASRNQGGEETKGFLRLIVPLYVAPAPVTSMVRARY